MEEDSLKLTGHGECQSDYLYTRYPIAARRAWPAGYIGYTERKSWQPIHWLSTTAQYLTQRNPYLKFSSLSLFYRIEI